MRRSVNSVRISIGNASASLKSSLGEDMVQEYSHPKVSTISALEVEILRLAA
jgi:hypothetical protein